VIGTLWKRSASASRVFRAAPFAVLLAMSCLAGPPGHGAEPAADDDAMVNPLLGDADAIKRGKKFYRARCIICHLKAGGRGPKIFRTDLSPEQFMETVINGRDGTQMPAFGERMSPDDVWAVHAYLMSRDRY
jgi:mono/diheme cytochrome c family protein